MLISFSALVVASQLIVAIADDVPNFNIERGYKVDSGAAFDPNAGQAATINGVRTTSNRQRDSFKLRGRNLRRRTRNCALG